MKADTRITRAAPRLSTEVVDSPAEFAALRPEWEALEARDPEATVFLSWAWMNEAFRDRPYRWSVFVVRDGGDGDRVIALLPLKYRLHWSVSRNELQTEIEAGGRLLFSEYTGFLCQPEQEAEALAELAAKLARMPWVRFSMRYVAQARRCRVFTEALEAQGLPVRFRDYRINGKTTDNLLCPQVELPESFETYLATQVSRSKRQRLRKDRRAHFEGGGYSITHADAESFETDLAALTRFWLAAWTESKGAEVAERVASNYAAVLRAAQATGTLFLPVLRRGGEPIGALGHVIDREAGSAHFIVIGRDPEAEESFIGSALHFHSIEWAISEGLICYDFCHGNEDYKYGYGAEDSAVLYFESRRRDPAPGFAFDALSTGAALERIEGFLAEGKHERARAACAQLANLYS
ncbi:GNAT family N-acetyltransferase [Roseivivax sp. GX 12232]|uniref:GNAT family N-acetyltransferase n=1 Tax=Roseivivax sp. GX 12232 TaxID=2900547 RepID=UPI001E4FCFC3|nr:GNAT family N-acetyltransferase [Roseivivax sp. GX 12232]MCE0503936.1 GNAT family N-acetyltransferase [Roseivivax sp. GX 12232]